jgi:hypothetical protein
MQIEAKLSRNRLLCRSDSVINWLSWGFFVLVLMGNDGKEEEAGDFVARFRGIMS